MCYQRFALCALAGYVLLFAAPVSATLLAADSFVYTNATPLNGSGGGTGFGSNWAGTGSTITAPGATYPGLATAGNAVLLDGTAGYTERNLSAAAGGVTGQSVYVTFTMQLLNGGAEFGGVRFGIPGYFVELGRNPFASYGLRVGFGASIINTGVGPSSTQSDLLVYEFATGAADTTINIWVNPTVGTPLGAPNASTTLTGTSGTFSGVGTGSQGNTTYRLDELRIGTSFADVAPSPVVIPEAETLALGALTCCRLAQWFAAA